MQECSLMKDLVKWLKEELKQVMDQMNLKPDQSQREKDLVRITDEYWKEIIEQQKLLEQFWATF